METSVYVIIVGAIFLFLPNAVWIGVSIIGIGLVLYYMGGKEPMSFAMSPPRKMSKYPLTAQYWPNKRRGGFSWGIKDPKKPVMETGQVTNSLNPGAPKMEDGMLNIPLPVSPEISNFLDLNYKKPTKGKRGKFERDDGKAFLPDF